MVHTSLENLLVCSLVTESTTQHTMMLLIQETQILCRNSHVLMQLICALRIRSRFDKQHRFESRAIFQHPLRQTGSATSGDVVSSTALFSLHNRSVNRQSV